VVASRPSSMRTVFDVHVGECSGSASGANTTHQVLDLMYDLVLARRVFIWDASRGRKVRLKGRVFGGRRALSYSGPRRARPGGQAVVSSNSLVGVAPVAVRDQSGNTYALRLGKHQRKLRPGPPVVPGRDSSPVDTPRPSATRPFANRASPRGSLLAGAGQSAFPAYLERPARSSPVARGFPGSSAVSNPCPASSTKNSLSSPL